MRSHLLAALVLTAACTQPKDPEVLLATTVESDLPALADQIDILGSLVADMSGASGTMHAETLGVGDCRWNVDTVADNGTGTVALGLVETPCGGGTGPADALAMQLDEGSLSGIWRQTPAGELIFELLGHRTATIAHGSRDYDASWTILGLEVYAEADDVRSWEAQVSYNGFAGQVWMLDVLSAAGSLRGELSDGTSSCLVGGSTGWPTVLCDLPEPDEGAATP